MLRALPTAFGRLRTCWHGTALCMTSKTVFGLVAAGLLQAAALSLSDSVVASGLWLLQMAALAWFYALAFAPPNPLALAASASATGARPALPQTQAPVAPVAPLLQHSTALKSMLFATTWLTATVYWLTVSMHVHGRLPLVLAWLFLLLFCAALALYYGLAMALAAGIMARAVRGPARGSHAVDLRSAVIFASCWMLAEWARGTLFTGFPWGAIGYAHTQGPLMQLAPWIGIYGICFAAALGSAYCVIVLRRIQRVGLRLATLALLVALLFAAGLLPRASFTQSSGTLQVQIAQSNIPMTRDVDARNRWSLQWLSRVLHAPQTQPGHIDLIVTPETSFPDLAQRLPAGWWAAQQAALAQRQQSAILGAIWQHGRKQYSNAAFLMGAAQLEQHARSPAQAADMAQAPRYEKYHLVPFGEWVPPLFRWLVDAITIPMVDFVRGATQAPAFRVKGQRLGMNICYEDLFSEELAQRFADAAAAPTLWVNMSNLGWFATPESLTSVVSQHREIARMRSLEFERASVRATNTGATVLLDHRGQTLAQLPYYREGVLTVSVQGRTGNTPYASWAAHWGLWPLVVFAVLALLLCLWPLRRMDPASPA